MKRPNAEELPPLKSIAEAIQKPLTPAEKLADLQGLAGRLQVDRIDFADRLPTLRHRAQEIGLPIRDAELLALLTAARRRRLGLDGLLGPGAVLDMSPEPWLWEGLLLRGCLNLLVALPKQGKTSLLVSMIAAWHQGLDSFLGRELTGPCPPVLIIGTDQGQADWGRMLQPAGLVDEDRRLVSPPIVNLAHAGCPVHLDPAGIDLIAGVAQNHSNLLVVIDSLAACVAPLGLREESPEIALPVAELMEQLEPHGATVVLIHHAAKGRALDGASSASRGSTALPALASQVLKLGPASPDNPSDRRRILTTEGRGGSPETLVIERDGGTWVLHGGIADLEKERTRAQVLSKLNDRQAFVLALLHDRWSDGSQPTTASDVVESLALVGKDAQSSALRILKQLQLKGLAQSTRLPDRLGARGAFAFSPASDTLPTVPAYSKKPVASDGSVVSADDTSDTTDAENRVRGRSASKVSPVDLSTGDPIRHRRVHLRLVD